ncbi:MAG: ATP-grasp domain-containing protein [Gemmatimonadetes bacterium]|nr:ATP-grasp domain-containing protein [Gemmatimonadota bacterium]
MNVIFIEPSFPRNQQKFPRALAEAGANVIGIGETPADGLPSSVKQYMSHYEQVGSVVREDWLLKTVQFIQSKVPVHRIEATVEAHIMAAARVREQCGIPGTSVKTAFLCRDKPAMKDVLREAGVPTAASIGAKDAAEARAFAADTGYPLIVKPRDGAGAADTYRVDSDEDLERVIRATGLDHGRSVAIEEFIEGHEGFYDTITIDGQVAHDFVSHYYPNVLEAMRTRWISPQFIATNRIDSAPDYQEVREMGKRVIEVLEIETSATHMEWFYGPKGLRFAEIGCRPPGVGAWDLYSAANDFDIYREWAEAITHGRTHKRPSRRFSAGVVALRPDRDGSIAGYDNIEQIHQRYRENIIDFHLPSVGTPTQGVEAGYMANAWIRMRHPDYDELRRILNEVGETVQVRAE